MESIYHLIDVPAAKMGELKEALTTARGLSGWWTTKTEKVGDDTLRFHFDGGYFKEFTVTQQSPQRIAWKCTEGHPEWKGSTVTFEMQESDGKIMLNFRHSGWKKQTPMYGICNYHWALYMKSLKELVETGKGNPTQIS